MGNWLGTLAGGGGGGIWEAFGEWILAGKCRCGMTSRAGTLWCRRTRLLANDSCMCIPCARARKSPVLRAGTLSGLYSFLAGGTWGGMR